MSRRKQAKKRVILPDPLFKSRLLAKFINILMRCGKKSVAERIVYGALDLVIERLRAAGKVIEREAEDAGSEGGAVEGARALKGALVFKGLQGDIRSNDKTRATALEVFELALERLKPLVEVRSRRVGGATYQVPMEIRGPRRMALSMRWLVDFSNKRSEKTMMQRLASEILDILESRGGAWKKREEMHRMAEANKAFAHYRW